MQNQHKNAFVDACNHAKWTSLYADLNFCRIVVTRDSNRSSSLLKYISTSWATEQTYRLWKPIDMNLDMCDAKVQKHQFLNLLAY